MPDITHDSVADPDDVDHAAPAEHHGRRRASAHPPAHLRTAPPAPHDEVVDPDVDLHDPRQVEEIKPHEAVVLAVIGAGGVLGALGRYGLATAIAHPSDGMPWSTLLINLVGSAVLGVLMVFVVYRTPHKLVRPFLGVGVCGGFTTFSTFELDLRSLLSEHRAPLALGYLALTLFGCLLAVELAIAATKRLVGVER